MERKLATAPSYLGEAVRADPNKKVDVKAIIEQLRDLDDEMNSFNVAGSQNLNIKNLRKAISLLRKIKV